VITTDTITFCWRLGKDATLTDLYAFARNFRALLDERGAEVGLISHDVRIADDATHEHAMWTAATTPRAALEALARIKGEVIAAMAK
jgi:hypothetical protein